MSTKQNKTNDVWHSHRHTWKNKTYASFERVQIQIHIQLFYAKIPIFVLFVINTHTHTNIHAYIHRRAHALCFCSYFFFLIQFRFISCLIFISASVLIQINIVLYVHYISACDLRTKSNTSCHSTPQHSSSDSEQPCDLRLFTPTTCLRELAVRP